MRLEVASILAGKFADSLKKACHRIEIAGSVRRRKAEVKDIELVAVPKLKYLTDLFGSPAGHLNLLDALCVDLGEKGIGFTKNGERYKQMVIPQGIKVDLFIVLPPAQWGVIFAIRTGPADFSKKIVTQRSKGGLLPDGYWVKNGCVANSDGPVPMSEETDYFKLLGIDFISPELRS